MGLLDKLWDDTVAGPTPETGLSRLRKFPPFFIRTDFSKDEGVGNGKASVEGLPVAAETTPRVTRSIMIRRPGESPRGNATPPESPEGSSTPPVSPLLGSSSSGGRTEWKRFRRKSMSDAYNRSSGDGVGSAPRPPVGAAEAGPAEARGVGSRSHSSTFEV